MSVSCFFFYGTCTTEFYTLSLHDALPIYAQCFECRLPGMESWPEGFVGFSQAQAVRSVASFPQSHLLARSEEHTSELQSQSNLVCRLLLAKKNIPACRPAKRWRPRRVSHI